MGRGKWEGKPFWLLPWQEQIIRDLIGVVREDGTRQFRTAFIEISKKQGKEVALDTPIPTPDGFSTMGEIQVGDVVFSDTGQRCHVVAKSDVDYSEQAFRITFKDGEVIEAGENHQWFGEYTHGKRKPCIMTTRQIYEMPRSRGCFRFRIAVAGCMDYPVRNLPIELILWDIGLVTGMPVSL